MTRNSIMAAGLLGALTVMATPAYAGPTSDLSVGDGKAVLVSPFVLQREEDLNFGSYVIQPATTGQVIIAPTSDTPTSITGLDAIPTSQPQRGVFDFAATPGQNVTVELTSFSGYMCLAGNACVADPANLATTLSFDGAETAPGSGIYGYTIPSDGVLRFFVGGKVDVPADVASGSYGEDFTVTLTYE